MSLDGQSLATFVSEETGLPFTGSSGLDADRNRWIGLEPQGHSAPHAFMVRIAILWRRLEITFEPGKFAGELLRSMAAADQEGRAIFSAVLGDCTQAGASVSFRVNGQEIDTARSASWPQDWSRLSLSIARGNLELGAEGGDTDEAIIRDWTARFMSAVIALLPLERTDDGEPDVGGYPEGSLIRVEVNRYERDRRNRSAALAIHGRSCKACGMSFEETYGSVASGFIEVHHVTPVSLLGADYVIDPRTDLVPLCPNCHAVVHRVSPPMPVADLAALLLTVASLRTPDD